MGSRVSVNIPSIVAGVLALVSLFSPWWGLVTTGFNVSVSTMYGPFFSPSQGGGQLNSSFTQFMNSYTPVILALALVTIALAFIGSFAPTARPLGAAVFLAVSSLVGYAALVSYGLSQNCQGNNCIRGLTGSTIFFNIITTWGFQTGFYLFLAGTVSMIVALAYHQVVKR